jgi:hypothetical protein
MDVLKEVQFGVGEHIIVEGEKVNMFGIIVKGK